MVILLALTSISSYLKNITQALLEDHYPDTAEEKEREEKEKREAAKREKESRRAAARSATAKPEPETDDAAKAE